MSEPRPASASLDDAERLRRAVLIVRQAFYGAADELGRLYGMERPCRACEQRRRGDRREEPKQDRAA